MIKFEFEGTVEELVAEQLAALRKITDLVERARLIARDDVSLGELTDKHEQSNLFELEDSLRNAAAMLRALRLQIKERGAR